MDNAIENLLQLNVDLRHFSVDVQKDLRKAENNVINKYSENFKQIINLYEDLNSCDKMITKIMSTLEHYQTNLRIINQEIIQLQQNTSQIDFSMKNRENLKNKVSQFIEKTVIDQSLINSILNESLSEQSFLENLHELSHKVATQKVNVFKGASASIEFMDVLNSLKLKAVERIVDFLHQYILKLKNPMTNYEMIQNVLLKYRFFNEFLIEHHPSAADFLCKEYVEIMSKVYSIYFKIYISKLSKISLNLMEASQNDFANDLTNKTGLNTVFFNKTKNIDSNNHLSLDERSPIWFSTIDHDVIVPNLYVDSTTKVSFEESFRSLNYLLFDNCCREYYFINDFFLPNIQRFKEIYFQILNPSFELFEKHYELSIVNSNDCIGITILMNITYRLNELSISKGLIIVGYFFEKYYDRLVTKLIKLLRVHTKNVSQLQSSSSVKKEKKPLPIIEKFSLFMVSMMVILHSMKDNRIDQCMMDFRLEIESFIQLEATYFSKQTDYLIFLIIQYDRIIQIKDHIVNQQTNYLQKLPQNQLQNLIDSYPNDIINRLNNFLQTTPVINSINNQLNNRIQDFIMEYLSSTIGNVIDFVKEAELSTNDLKNFEEKVKFIKIDSLILSINTFNKSWKSISETSINEIQSFIPNIHKKAFIIQKLLSNLIEICQKLKSIETLVTDQKYSALISNKKIASLVDPQMLIVEFRKIIV